MKFKLNDRVLFDGKYQYIIGVDRDGSDGTGDYFLQTIDQGSTLGNYLFTHRDCSFIHGVNEHTIGRWVQEDYLEIANLQEMDSNGVINENFLRRFKSGAVRSDDRGREKPSFISPYALKFLAEHFSANAAFFNGDDSAKNYMKGIEPVDIEDSLERHVLDFKFAMMPHRRDTAAIKKSLVEIMANCVMGLHQIGMAEDGEYKEIYEKTEYIKKEEK